MATLRSLLKVRSCVGDPASDDAIRGLMDTACHKCGGDILEGRETVPYVGPGPCVVTLQNVTVSRCSRCGDVVIDVPNRHALDVLVRCLELENKGATPLLDYRDGRWQLARSVTD